MQCHPFILGACVAHFSIETQRLRLCECVISTTDDVASMLCVFERNIKIEEQPMAFGVVIGSTIEDNSRRLKNFGSFSIAFCGRLSSSSLFSIFIQTHAEWHPTIAFIFHSFYLVIKSSSSWFIFRPFGECNSIASTSKCNKIRISLSLALSR